MKQVVEAQCNSCLQETDCQGCDVYNQAMEAFRAQQREDELDEIQSRFEKEKLGM